jgi:hypothetical protein
MIDQKKMRSALAISILGLAPCWGCGGAQGTRGEDVPTPPMESPSVGGSKGHSASGEGCTPSICDAPEAVVDLVARWLTSQHSLDGAKPPRLYAVDFRGDAGDGPMNLQSWLKRFPRGSRYLDGEIEVRPDEGGYIVELLRRRRQDVGNQSVGVPVHTTLVLHERDGSLRIVSEVEHEGPIPAPAQSSCVDTPDGVTIDF